MVKNSAATSAITPWISGITGPEENQFFRFRKRFRYSSEGGQTSIRISADSRYWLYLNGTYLGTGPVRSWTNHWKFDEYDITPLLKDGNNVIAVRVNHFGTGNFQYLPAPCGLWLEAAQTIGKGSRKIFLTTGNTWKWDTDPANKSSTPRISIQEAFEEQFDARLEDEWLETDYADSKWRRAKVIAPPHPSLKLPGIPHLTREPVYPKRIVRSETVKPCSGTWTLNVKACCAPKDLSSNIAFMKGYLATQIWSSVAQSMTLLRPHYHTGHFKLNGKLIPALITGMTVPMQPQKVRLKAGWNQLLFPYPGGEAASDGLKPAGAVHLAQFVLSFAAAQPVQWSATGKKSDIPWAFIGPFQFTDAEKEGMKYHVDYPRIVLPEKIHPSATNLRYSEIFLSGKISPELCRESFFRKMDRRQVFTTDVAAASFADEVVGSHVLENSAAMLSDNAEWTTVPPAPNGLNVRILVDFGAEVLGHHVLEVNADSGVILDFHNFEFIQPDGRENYADGMNNSFRYTCRDGLQSFRTLQRRGFQYSWLTLRNQKKPVHIRNLHLEMTTYPQARQGSFVSSDTMLNKIWEVGAHTLRCCSEDTYTDCPSYEQTHWVGDTRNEALIDWVVNGDPRLWFRSLEQAGQSLEKQDLVASHVPSSWGNILPLWHMLWMRSCREYLLWTGDYHGAGKLWPWVLRAVKGIEKNLNSRGLFEMQGWNMFDWAAMDTPSRGVITHLNCFAVLVLEECAELGGWLGKTERKKFLALAKSIRQTINRDLWDAKTGAFIDSIHIDGVRSPIFSQQTQTAALIANIASGPRAKRLRKIVHQPPAGFVKAGSPFFEFFLLEVMSGEGKEKAFLDLIRKDWGFMIEQGATTFWEMWSLKTGRLTRSHCHGWSGAPTFFLSTLVLGIRPLKPGFAEIEFSPLAGDLKWARGTLPTPHGNIEVSWKKTGKKFTKTLGLPGNVKLKKST